MTTFMSIMEMNGAITLHNTYTLHTAQQYSCVQQPHTCCISGVDNVKSLTCFRLIVITTMTHTTVAHTRWSEPLALLPMLMVNTAEE